MGIDQHRRRVFAWRGAAIGTFIGFLTLGSLLFAMSSNPKEGEGIAYLIGLFGIPADFVLEIVCKLFTVVLDVICPGQMASKIEGIICPLLLYGLSIPLNCGMFGFVIDWLVGNFRGSHAVA